MDERPVRCWIHPHLKEELEQWQKVINQIAIEQTNYPVQRLENLPLTSNICSMRLKKVRKSLKKGDFKISKDKKTNNLKIEIQKIRGIKKNEIMFW